MRRTSRAIPKKFELESASLVSLRGGPRGLLLHYILHRIAAKPSHGYEILQSIESKTEGAWRPGAGSIYPILRSLVSKGLIEAQEGGGGDTRRVYRITREGLERLKERKQMFANFGKQWSLIRGLLIDLIEPEYIESFFLDVSKRQFQSAQDILGSKTGSLPRSQVEYILKEYALNLERQLDWTNQMLRELKSKPMVARTR